MSRKSRHELMYTGFTWIIIAVITFQTILKDIVLSTGGMYYPSLGIGFLFLVAVAIFTFSKTILIKKGVLFKDGLYISSRFLEIIFIHIAMVLLGIDKGAGIILIFLILITSLYKGRRFSLTLTGFAFLLNISLHILSIKESNAIMDDLGGLLPNIVLFYLALFLISILCSRFYSDSHESEQQNKKLFMELANRYDQVAVAREEIKSQNDKLKDTNYKLEDANKRLMTSLAELFTLQQITQAISSILDINELLKKVNDIIIGVMGVSGSTIIRYDEKRGRLKVHTTNITKRGGLITLNDNVNCEILIEALMDGNPIIESNANADKYPFIEDRGVKSLICVPLITKSQRFGLVLVEHKYLDAFDENNVRLLNIIGQQVGIAMENVELYQRMHELATVDSLTGVYNRLYFQDKFKEEFESAQKNKYELSVALLDIDHFKRFNDTYGHLFGDKVLKRIATIIKNSLRSGDIIARYGGEEFVMILPRAGIKEAYYKVERLRGHIAKTKIRDGEVASSVTVSFGVSSYPEFSSSESELLKMADDALYVAKNSGRNCVKVAGEAPTV
ncbi:MAG: GGDEF domain-containing protein [Clostridium sp.]|nr:GGDEF domain-containing protein [Clostridium sp.]